ncbi:MAG: NBR1-Ig-like domain-containing protein [Bacteroidota bacterium]
MHCRPAYLTIILLALAACAPAPSATPFIPPAAPLIATPTRAWTPPPSPLPPTPPPATPVASLPASPSPSPEAASAACTNNLTFIQDLTVPDGTLIPPGGNIEKKWLVENSGTCDWDSSYRLKWTAGELLGATAEQALYPARAGAQAVLSIPFTAPLEPGTYQSEWYAFAPDGLAFGEAVYMTIVVSP